MSRWALVAMALLMTLGGCVREPGTGTGKTLEFTINLYEVDPKTGAEHPAGRNYVWAISVTAKTMTNQPLQVSPGKPWGASGAAKTDDTGQASYSILVEDNLGPCIVTWTARLFTGGGSWAAADFEGPPGTSVIGGNEMGEVEVHEVGGTITVSYDIKVN